MCSRCEPTFDGYVYWDDTLNSAFYYRAEPVEFETWRLASLINGPLDINIPYV